MTFAFGPRCRIAENKRKVHAGEEAEGREQRAENGHVMPGWVLVFSFDTHSIVDSATKAPADLFARSYFVGYTMFTVGNGDLKPNGPWWRIATTLIGGSGLGSVTLAITFLLEVLAAVLHQRTLGAYITDLGATPEKIISRAWHDRFQSLEHHFVQLSGMIHLFTEQHLASRDSPRGRSAHRRRRRRSSIASAAKAGSAASSSALSTTTGGVGRKRRSS